MGTRAIAPSGLRRGLVATLMLAATTVLAAACLPEGRACAPGDYATCTCANGAAGAALCNTEGTAYGACDCTILTDGAVPPAIDAGADANEGGDPCSGTSGLGLTCACADDSQCASDLCFSFPSKGPHCTAHCTTDNDCPPPALGCNPQKICKVP